MRLALFDLDHTLLSGDSDVLWCEFLINQQHRDSGHTLVLTTATNRVVSALTAADLGVDHYLATEVEMVDGRFTGRTQGVLNMRTGKVERLRQWLQAQGQPESVLKQAAFYTDSINDLPLLSVVRRPVVVDPDPRLESAALRKGWKVLRFKR
jgi:phosphoserine phosphatase